MRRVQLVLLFGVGQRDAVVKLHEPYLDGNRGEVQNGLAGPQDIRDPLRSGTPVQFGMDAVRVDEQDFLHAVDLAVDR